MVFDNTSYGQHSLSYVRGFLESGGTPFSLCELNRRRDVSTCSSRRLATSFWLHHALGRGGIPRQHLRWADRSWHKITAAVWTNTMQQILGAGGAEGAFI